MASAFKKFCFRLACLTAALGILFLSNCGGGSKKDERFEVATKKAKRLKKGGEVEDGLISALDYYKPRDNVKLVLSREALDFGKVFSLHLNTSITIIEDESIPKDSETFEGLSLKADSEGANVYFVVYPWIESIRENLNYDGTENIFSLNVTGGTRDASAERIVYSYNPQPTDAQVAVALSSTGVGDFGRAEIWNPEISAIGHITDDGAYRVTLGGSMNIVNSLSYGEEEGE